MKTYKENVIELSPGDVVRIQREDGAQVTISHDPERCDTGLTVDFPRNQTELLYEAGGEYHEEHPTNLTVFVLFAG